LSRSVVGSQPASGGGGRVVGDESALLRSRQDEKHPRQSTHSRREGQRGQFVLSTSQKSDGVSGAVGRNQVA
jgi:hypothetical protein